MPNVRVDGCEIHYEVTGSGDAVLLLHGLGSTIADWEFQIPVLAKQYQVISVEMRGHGRSDKPPGPYRVATFASDVTRVLDTLACGPAHVIGISMGGMIGFQLAVDAPAHVRSLTVVNSGPALRVRTLAERFAIFKRLVALRLVGLPGLAKKIAEFNLPHPEQAALRDKIATRLASTDPVAYRASLDALIGWDVEDKIGDIKCPTLIITSDSDYTPVSFKQAYAAKMPNARLSIVANSRHLTPMDQPEALNRLLLDFLAECTKEGGS